MTESRPRWEIILTRQAEKSLHRLSKNLLQRIDQAILALAENPRPAESHQLADNDNLYRLPAEEWRITYMLEEERKVILILEIASKQQPERYPLEELDESSAPQTSDGLKGLPEDFHKALMGQVSEVYFRTIGAFGSGSEFAETVNFIRQTRKKIHVLIVDDLPETRENLRKLLFFEPDIEVVGVATNGEEAVQMAVELQPDIVLMDIIMPGINGITATELISQQIHSAQVIVMSVQGDADTFRRAMLAGAREFLIKPFSGDELMTSIRRVYHSAALQKQHATPEIASTQDAFEDLKARIQDRLMAELDPTIDISRPNELGRTILRNKFEQILAQENIILSRSERERLFESIVAEILQTELDETQKKALAQWFRFFKLGKKVEISLSVADLSESLSFYKKLDLEKVDSGEKPYPWAVVSDGQFYLGLHQQVFSSPTLSYFTLHGLSERMDHLPKLGSGSIIFKNSSPSRVCRITSCFMD